MSYQALARKYRPQSFRDVVGQETVVRTLQNAIEQKRIHHAYLFSGVRGVGKTTSARIVAKALNCVTGPTLEPCNECTICREITEGIDMDVREIDAATYTGVDNIRELRDVTQFQPARDKYRIFIIDEAHMLSAGAWNALLKILEEPPSHVVFMFATTEIHKVPATILSRVQKFMLRKITLDELIGQLQRICEWEGIEADRGALEIVARRGEGSVRDALSLLDQIIAFSGRSITAADVATILGLADHNFFARVVELIADGDHTGIIEALQEAADSGRDFKMLYRDLLNFVRNLLLISGGAKPSMLAASPEDLTALQTLGDRFNYTELLRIANLLLKDDETVNRAEHQRLAVEIALLKAATFPRLRAIEQVVAQGGATPRPSSYSASAPPTRIRDTQTQDATHARDTTTQNAMRPRDTQTQDASFSGAAASQPAEIEQNTGIERSAGTERNVGIERPRQAESLSLQNAAAARDATTQNTTRARDAQTQNASSPGAAGSQPAEIERNTGTERSAEIERNTGTERNGGIERPRQAESLSLQETGSARDAQTRNAETDVSTTRGSSTNVQELIDKVQSQRPLTASYLLGAKSMRKKGNRITFVFDASDTFYADTLNEKDMLRSLELTAEDVYGEPTRVAIELFTSEQKNRRDDDKPGASSLRDDPVVKSFARHLGGELIERKR
jgi:DNA polymerase-3 subunit gamma/tau